MKKYLWFNIKLCRFTRIVLFFFFNQTKIPLNFFALLLSNRAVTLQHNSTLCPRRDRLRPRHRSISTRTRTKHKRQRITANSSYSKLESFPEPNQNHLTQRVKPSQLKQSQNTPRTRERVLLWGEGANRNKRRGTIVRSRRFLRKFLSYFRLARWKGGGRERSSNFIFACVKVVVEFVWKLRAKIWMRSRVPEKG